MVMLSKYQGFDVSNDQLMDNLDFATCWAKLDVADQNRPSQVLAYRISS